jgi:hypothetical protein
MSWQCPVALSIARSRVVAWHAMIVMEARESTREADDIEVSLSFSRAHHASRARPAISWPEILEANGEPQRLLLVLRGTPLPPLDELAEQGLALLLAEVVHALRQRRRRGCVRLRLFRRLRRAWPNGGALWCKIPTLTFGFTIGPIVPMLALRWLRVRRDDALGSGVCRARRHREATAESMTNKTSLPRWGIRLSLGIRHGTREPDRHQSSGDSMSPAGINVGQRWRVGTR